ncbi:MAG: hypothetical protein DHS20C21_01350 [Gemmatimonadota bacterium]|nr:MAG: hypothetical protein DHS20C21_01350 [Gemmatimonadota bacterium]
MGELNERHVADLESSGLTAETIAASGCRSVDSQEARRFLGYPGGQGLAFPYPHTAVNGDRPYERLKPDEPLKDDDGRARKYLSPSRRENPSGNRLYIPANLPEGALGDVRIALVFTEGEKKTLAGNQEGFATVGLPGVSCFVSRGEDGESYAIADLDLVEWNGREVYVAFDSDATTKTEVGREEEKLAWELESRGATVRIARLPKPTGSENRDNDLVGKFGMDDFLKVRGKAAFAEILKKAKRPPKKDAHSGERRYIAAADLADWYVKSVGLESDAGFQLRWWREEFYRFTGTHYERIPESDLRTHVIGWLRSKKKLRRFAGTRMASQVAANVAARGAIDASQEPPIWLDGRGDTGEVLSLQNGVISIKDLLAANFEALHPHDPAFFCLSSLPFQLDPGPDCSRWMTFMEEALPDSEVRDLVQEVFGYLISNEGDLEKFFLLVGAGANGKTVVCTVLREILGPDNVSAVGLEAFSATRTFPLAATIGKKANIVEELEEVGKPAEGVLKNYVTRKPTTIERKHRDAFEFTPTARLVFATNVLPRFVDPTDGLWRRMVYIPFTRQILDESKQDTRLIDGKWWRASGELPAIFLWALAGLARLRSRGRFPEPGACRVAKGDYRRDSNPTASFLSEHCRLEEGGETSTSDLYAAYRAWADANGCRPVAVQRFTQEVRRVFPGVEASKNPRFIAGKRSRAWQGLTRTDL